VVAGKNENGTAKPLTPHRPSYCRILHSIAHRVSAEIVRSEVSELVCEKWLVIIIIKLGNNGGFTAESAVGRILKTIASILKGSINSIMSSFLH